ncbi:GH3 family domain-containing protein [Actibacterium pelagium]|uniref:GH3 auxin-responsive promoter n=1 Tax=Actibacterium pelagium TaxID=2029103 RepID=A0A917AMH4_9RHOB|nr:GH3 auxin-responsive promoter family protein [Actibacterium pelagium]GGE61904.1 hypothetical protein GCM10011517_31930 [Actibacterium pelagium]
MKGRQYTDWTGLARLYARARTRRIEGTLAEVAQRDLLRKLLAKASKTKFGKAHNFDEIEDIEDFQRNVPIRGYDQFWQEWWQPDFPELVDVCWPGKIPFFTMTSGTTSGRSKYIPYTNHMRRAAVRGFLDLLCFHLKSRPHSRLLGGAVLALTGPVALENRAKGAALAAVSAVTAAAVPNWLQHRVLPPSELANVEDWQEKIARLSPIALTDDVRCLGGSPNWLLIFLAEVAKHSSSPDAQLKDWFPNLELIIHGGVNFAPYRDEFAALLKGSHAETREMYSASEGVFAYADRGDGEGLRLHLDGSVFFEFVDPAQLQHSSPDRRWIETVEANKDYALVITSAAGLWSYVVGDVVRFVELDPPRLIVVGRVQQGLSTFGEHLIETEITEAISAAAHDQNTTILDYSVGTLRDETGGYHLYLVEPMQGVEGFSAVEFAKRVDRRLSELNEDYEELRRNQAIGAPQAKMVKPGGFARWMKLRRGLGGQNKIPRIVTDTELFRDIRDIVLDPKGETDDP